MRIKLVENRGIYLFLHPNCPAQSSKAEERCCWARTYCSCYKFLHKFALWQAPVPPSPTARPGPSFGVSHASVLFRPLAFFQHLLRWFYEFYHLLALGRRQFLLPFEQFLSRKSTFNCLGRRLKRLGGLHIAHFSDGRNFSFVPRLLPLTVEV